MDPNLACNSTNLNSMTHGKSSSTTTTIPSNHSTINTTNSTATTTTTTTTTTPPTTTTTASNKLFDPNDLMLNPMNTSRFGQSSLNPLAADFCLLAADIKPIDDTSGSLTGSHNTPMDINNCSPAPISTLAATNPTSSSSTATSSTTTGLNIKSNPVHTTNGHHNLNNHNHFAAAAAAAMTTAANNNAGVGGFLTRNKMSIDSNLNRLHQTTSFNSLATAVTAGTAGVQANSNNNVNNNG